MADEECRREVAFFKTEKERVVKRLLLCRHGQGYHNVLDESSGKPKLHIPDPELTSQGIEEASAIFSPSARFDFQPQIVFVSPLWRTLQTATHALNNHPSPEVRPTNTNTNRIPMIAMDLLMEHNNLNKCNHRSTIGERHFHVFPHVDFSRLASKDPPTPGAEWIMDESASYKECFQLLRSRAELALERIGTRSEDRIVAVCHGSFIRALMSNVFRLGPHHAVQSPQTGESIEIWQIETPDGERYWELNSDNATNNGREVVRLAIRNTS